VNRTVINTTTVSVTNINVRNITYANTQVNNAVIVTSSERFGRGGQDYTHPSPQEVREWHPAERGIEVRPTAASLVPGEGRAVHPPQDYVERPVVAMRAPHDPRPSLHAAGIEAPAGQTGPALRVVSPRTGSAPTEESLDRPRAVAPAHSPESPGAIPGQQARPESPRLPEQHAAAQSTAQVASPSANRPPVAERMRPPPPPSFNDWRSRQQVTPTEGRETATARAVSPPPPVPNAQVHAAQGGRSEPSAVGVEQRNLPGEPAMKLRPTQASGTASKGGGNPPCKEHECK
jgi:hypothetical protein